MGVVLYRIDDRLIHGQVMTGWSKVYKANQIFVIDDYVAKDEFLCQVMTMSVPQGICSRVYGFEEGAEKIKNDSPKNRTIVLTKTPDMMKRLVDAGCPMEKLNVGGMGFQKERKAVLRNIQISPKELEVLQEIAGQKVHVFCQIVPDDKSIELDKIKLA